MRALTVFLTHDRMFSLSLLQIWHTSLERFFLDTLYIPLSRSSTKLLSVPVQYVLLQFVAISNFILKQLLQPSQSNLRAQFSMKSCDKTRSIPLLTTLAVHHRTTNSETSTIDMRRYGIISDDSLLINAF